MAELASGAVTSLLGVIRNEWRLLGHVGGDVQFIREEMESMNSFLMHLARTVPPGGEHDEQVRTWMNQVRELAHDCNNCIDRYLYRGNPDIHLGRDRLRRYIRWFPWFLQKMVAQHRAALELSELKERARDVGKRRLRYGVEVPKAAAAPGSTGTDTGPGAAAEGRRRSEADAAPFVHVDGEEDEHDQVVIDGSGRIRRALFGLYVLEDYFNDQLTEWIEQVRHQWSQSEGRGWHNQPAEWKKDVRDRWSWRHSHGQHDTQCIAFVVPSTEDSGAIAHQASAVAKKHVNNTILVDIPSLHYWYALGPKNILYYILREIQLQQLQQDAKSQTQQQQQDQADEDDGWARKRAIREQKRQVIEQIKENIGKLKVVEKIKEIEAQIVNAKNVNITKTAKKEEYITKDKIDKEYSLGTLLVLLLRSSSAAAVDEMEKKAIPTLAEHYDDILKRTAEKLQEHMEQVNKGAGRELQRVIHNRTQYAHILHKVFPKISGPSKTQEQDSKQATSETTPGKSQIKEIIDKVKQDILSEVFMAISDNKSQQVTMTNSTTTLNEDHVKRMIQEAIQQLKEEKPADKKQETCVSGGQDPTTTEACTGEPKGKGQLATGSNPAQDQIQGVNSAEAMEKTREILNTTIKQTIESNQIKPRQALEQDTKQATSEEATPGKNQIKEIVDKVKQEILSEVFTDQVKKLIEEAKLEILKELKEDKPDKKQATGVPGGKCSKEETKMEDTQKTKILDATIEETIENMEDVEERIERQLHINGIVDKIQNHLNGEETLIILNADEKYVSQWEQTRNALSLLPKVAVVMILTNTEDIQERAKEKYCYPPGEPIDYSSLAALYHGIVLEITRHQKNEDNYDPKILRRILDKCEPNELCMKIFAHTLYAKPKRSKEELHKLHDALEALPQKSYRSIAMKMFKFSYRNMPKEYQSCLLYLAIFPRGHKIRRSTLIGRLVAERMITTEDWRWSSSVHKAEQCFDALITRGLVYSAEISATGRVKSCMVGDLAYEFITKIAKKQRILEARLSHHLAWHFSLFNDLHLRVSDKINNFLERLSESSQWSRLKVLDLEGCKCFKNKQRYLKNICNKIVLLKYLSLRGTDVNWLPNEINNLRDLEILDIQQTDVPEYFTRDLLLLKLKCLLAGNKNPSPNNTSIGTSSQNHVLVPEKIEKMLDMEVLSNVKAKKSRDLDDIGKLWQLRKLGVVIKDKDTHHTSLIKAISNMHECLQSLSITLDTTRDKGARSMDSGQPKHSTKVLDNETRESPKVLERLSISGNILEGQILPLGNILEGQLLPLLLTDKNSPLIKVTLSKISLDPSILGALSNMPKLHCLKLRHNRYRDNKLIFKKGEFKKLKYFLVEGSDWITISFEEDTAAPELEKIVLSFNNIESIAGVDHLKRLEELELNQNDKSSNKIGGTTNTAATNHTPSTTADTFAPKPSPQPPNAAAAAVAASPSPPAPSPPISNDAVNPSLSAPSPPVSTDPAPSTPTATPHADNPSPSAPTTSSDNMLLPKLLSDAKQISKVTLRGTMLTQDGMRILSMMENIRCLVLLRGSYNQSRLDLKKDEFAKLNLLIVNCPEITEIKFDSGSAPKLEKIVWTYDQRTSLSGIEHLPRLKELEFTGDSLPGQVKEDIDKHKDRIHCAHYKPERKDQTVRSTGKEDSVSSCLYSWKDKGWHRRN